MKQLKIGFIGLGLIGGSIAMAIKKAYPDASIYAFDHDIDTLVTAQNDGTIDVICLSIDISFSECNFVFLCTPVISNTSYLKMITSILSKDCILTDVGSVKENIHKQVIEYGLSSYFIGGHPMAGSEKSGYKNANSRLFENAYYILTPSADISQKKVGYMNDLITAIGAIPIILNASTHDHATAGISHLPHIIASSLVDFIRTEDSDDEIMRTLAAGGFKDITRIASSSPEMWRDICLTNNHNISDLLFSYIKKLTEIHSHITTMDKDWLFHFFDTAKEYRESMQDASLGPIKKSYVLYCDIPDETGIIATIASLLAKHSISIKNIGIIHNREFESGVLKIEFYEESSSLIALDILRSYNYIIYERN